MPGSRWALEQAKQNVLLHYLLVGVTEELGDFIAVLEATLPRFFKDATQMFNNGEQPAMVPRHVWLINADCLPSFSNFFSLIFAPNCIKKKVGQGLWQLMIYKYQSISLWAALSYQHWLLLGCTVICHICQKWQQTKYYSVLTVHSNPHFDFLLTDFRQKISSAQDTEKVSTTTGNHW